MSRRIQNPRLAARVTSADEAAALVPNGATLGLSGFTGCGYPKALGPALARRAAAERGADRPFRLRILAGASTGPELDGALAAEKAIAFRFPYQSDAALRAQINGGEVAYQDLHLSHAGALVRYGYYDPIDFAIVEVTRVREDGALV
ncbi:MAG TPA: CoA-transferase, partial [Anaeromyxobacteraceae bacterium]|nr:CoA-transferase [Anaeromyxobacteraceae bacterium]